MKLPNIGDWVYCWNNTLNTKYALKKQVLRIVDDETFILGPDHQKRVTVGGRYSWIFAPKSGGFWIERKNLKGEWDK